MANDKSDWSLAGMLHGIYRDFAALEDPVLKTWFPFGSLVTPVVILGMFLSFALKIGPAFMKYRKPFELKYIIILCNSMQIIFNAFVFTRVVEYILRNIHTIHCLQVESPSSDDGLALRVTVWLFVINKMTDFADTLFLILRKKPITFFHLYHHSSTFLVSWIFTKYFLVGQFVLFAGLNSLIHVFVYSYFLLSLVERFKKFANKFKMFLPLLQLLHVLITIAYFYYGYILESCIYPKYMVPLLTAQVISIIVMIVSFIFHATREVKPRSKTHYIKKVE